MNDFEMPAPEKKADFVKENFDVISEKYDLFNDLNSFFLHRVWKNQVAKTVANFSKKPLVCLDLCCGTGDISLRLNQLANTQIVHSVDFSEKMLDIARVKLKTEQKAIIKQGDATFLKDFADTSLDVVTIGFGLRNVNNLEKALGEIYRVLKPGGLFINLDVGKVKNPIIRFFADFYFFKIVPLMGYIIWGGKNKMFDYLPVSSLHYPAQDELKGILEKIGFEKVSYKNFVFGNATMHLSYKPI